MTLLEGRPAGATTMPAVSPASMGQASGAPFGGGLQALCIVAMRRGENAGPTQTAHEPRHVSGAIATAETSLPGPGWTDAAPSRRPRRAVEDGARSAAARTDGKPAPDVGVPIV